MSRDKNKKPVRLESLVESMTGYGEARAQLFGVNFTCRLRSLNHRFLDLKIRLPRADLLGLDIAVRKRLVEVFKRGSIEITLLAESKSSNNDTVINTLLAQKYWDESTKLAKQLTGKSKVAVPTLSIEGLLRLPGVVTAAANEDALEDLSDEDVASIFNKVIDPAIQNLKLSRQSEGQKLKAHILSLLDEMDDHLKSITKVEQPEKEKARAMIIERANETLKLINAQSVDLPARAASEEFSSRLREEAVFWIERRDFTEERMRLGMHLKSFRELLEIPGDAAGGRKLEFIQQEILREINTLGTKAQSPSVTPHTIELKTILERVREQLANVE